MSITFHCSECAETYEVDPDMAGKTIRCRECNAYGRVPYNTLELAPSFRKENVSAPHRFSFRHGLLAGLLLATLGSGLGLCWGLHKAAEEPHVAKPANNQSTVVEPITASAVQPILPLPNLEQERQQEEWERQQAQAEATELRQIELEQQAQLNAEWMVRQIAKEAEQERLRKIQLELGLLSPQEQNLVFLIVQRMNRGENISFGHICFMDAHWIIFDTPEVHYYLRKQAALFGIEEICTNLDIPPDNRTAYAVSVMLHWARTKKAGHTLLAVTRQIKANGVAALPTAYKMFIRQNPALFPGLVP